ncbi:MAG: T9SS type A sorting domain-containing protein [Bacteroidota bacterium]
MKKPLQRVRGAPRVFFGMLFVFVIGSVGFFPASMHAQNEGDKAFEKSTELPPWFIQPFGIVEHKDHPGFAQYSAALGDVNGDGYDDLAITTSYDTTFLFFGGDTLDPHEDGFVLGGSGGVAALDLNGDGRRDLVTSMQFRNTPNETGIVRIYFQLDSPPYFSDEPDLVLTGLPGTRLGAPSLRSGVKGLDYNGDGFADLSVAYVERRDSSVGCIQLYLGSTSMDTSADRVFRPSRSSKYSTYGNDYISGDINGDGYDDIMIGGVVYDWSVGRYNQYWDLYLGNMASDVSTPHRFFDDIYGWSPSHPGLGMSGISDVNADGYADIIDDRVHRVQGDALLFLGSDPLPDPILPSDSIPNRDPGLWGDIAPWGIYPVGDMNGDGTRDLIIPWAVYMVDGPLYLMYPAGTSFHKPMGYRGIIPTDWRVDVGAFDAGDMNGDGCDDMVILGTPGPEAEGYGNRFVIFLGAKQMQTSVIEADPIAPDGIQLQVYPNPVQIGISRVSLRLEGLTTGAVSLALYDALGRVHLRTSIDATASSMDFGLPLPELRTGIYHLRIQQGERNLTSNITIL